MADATKNKANKKICLAEVSLFVCRRSGDIAGDRFLYDSVLRWGEGVNLSLAPLILFLSNPGYLKNVLKPLSCLRRRGQTIRL